MIERSVPKALQKTIVRLHERRGRKKLGLILLEGEKVVGLAAQLGLEIRSIVADVDHPELAGDHPAAYLATRAQMAKLATTTTPPPVLAVARQPASSLDLVPEVRARGVLALDGVQDPGNVGALTRTAQAFGVGAVVLGKGVADRWSPKVIRGSMGAVLSLATLEVEDLALWLTGATEQGRTIYLAEAEGGMEPSTLTPIASPWCLVLGSEAHGVSSAVRAVPGATSLTLGIHGAVGSLGVAAAGAVLLHLLCARPRAH